MEAVIESPQPASDVPGKAAVAAVQQWSFEPGKAKREPVAAWIVVPVWFRLH
jgi:outer membrane biosynthesis protein TonB